MSTTVIYTYVQNRGEEVKVQRVGLTVSPDVLVTADKVIKRRKKAKWRC